MIVNSFQNELHVNNCAEKSLQQFTIFLLFLQCN